MKLTGYYQYTPGETYRDANGNAVNRTDEGDIYAVVYKNTDDSGNACHLNGTNVLTSELIVAKALSGHVGKTNGWTQFEIPFEYTSQPDPEVLANYGYSLAIVFTSSCGGASFEGAVGSTLLIDKVRIIADKDNK